MRQHHSLLDIGCGSLRGGRLFIPYLNSNCYYGVEPEKWLVKEGISKECGQDLINLKSPSFLYTRDFSFDRFNVKFDYILAQSVFSHTTSEQIQKCLNAVRLCLRDEHSVCAATFIHGEKDYREDKCIYPQAAAFTPVTVKNMISNCDLFGKFTRYYHPTQAWYIIGLPKSKEHILAVQKSINDCAEQQYLRYRGLI